MKATHKQESAIAHDVIRATEFDFNESVICRAFNATRVNFVLEAWQILTCFKPKVALFRFTGQFHWSASAASVTRLMAKMMSYPRLRGTSMAGSMRLENMPLIPR